MFQSKEMKPRPLVTKHLGGHCTLREHQIEQPLLVLGQLLIVGFGLLDVGKWLQNLSNFQGCFLQENSRSGCSLGSCFVQFDFLGKNPDFLSSLLARGFHIGLLKP